MHLSRLVLNRAVRAARIDLGNAYAMHQTLRWAFPGAGEPGTELSPDERILWRFEGEATLLVQSVAAPDWAALNARAPSYLDRWDVKRVDLASVLTPDRPLHFRLRANPTVRRVSEGGKSRRYGLRRPEEQSEWLHRQGDTHGFAVLDASILAAGRERHWKPSGGPPLTLDTVTFDGVLRVQDSSALHAALLAGLGHAKALGCGLLSLAPA